MKQLKVESNIRFSVGLICGTRRPAVCLYLCPTCIVVNKATIIKRKQNCKSQEGLLLQGSVGGQVKSSGRLEFSQASHSKRSQH